MTFAEALQAAMDIKGLKAVDVSEKSGVAASYLSKLATGRVREPTWTKACQIIDSLGMTPDEFRALMNSDEMGEKR